MRSVACIALLALVQLSLAPSALANDFGLKKAIVQDNLKAAETAVERLVDTNSAAAAETLIKLFPMAVKRGERWYWMVIKGLAAFTAHDPLEKVAEFVVKYKSKSAGKDTLYWLQSNYSPYAATTLISICGKVKAPLQVMILDHLATLKQKATVLPLLDLLEQRNKKTRDGKKEDLITDKILVALHAVTEQNFGTSVDMWRNWWAKNKGRQVAHKGNTVAGIDLGGGRGKGLDKLKKGDKGRIIVIKATRAGFNYDSIESMLAQLGVPHTVMTKEQFNSKDPDLSNVVALFVNCTNIRETCVCPTCKPGGAKTGRLNQCTGCDKHIIIQDILDNESIKNIKEYVERKSGYLFTEDHGMYEVMERGFKDYLQAGKVLVADTVGVTPAAGMTTHPYLKRVFARTQSGPIVQAGEGGSVELPKPKFEKINHTWKIDDQSPAIKIKNKSAVKVLMESKELADEQGCESPVAVLVGVNSGSKVNITGTMKESQLRGGRLVHVLSHFTKQSSARDGNTMKNLLLNYLIEANERFLSRMKKRQK